MDTVARWHSGQEMQRPGDMVAGSHGGGVVVIGLTLLQNRPQWGNQEFLLLGPVVLWMPIYVEG